LYFNVTNSSAAARQQKDKHRLRYEPVNESVTNLTKFCYPPKAYQIYDIDTNRAKSSTNNQRTKTSSSTNDSTTDQIRPVPSEEIESTLPRPNSSSSTNRVKITVSVTRILNTRRCKSTANEKKHVNRLVLIKYFSLV
jgi:hypothetical protein